MKTASTALTALLNAAGGQQPLIQYDLYNFNLAGGGTLLYSTADFPITASSSTIWNAPAIGGGTLWYSGMTWLPGPFDDETTKATAHWKVGLDSDTWQIKIAPRAFDPVTGATFPDTIGSTPWLAAVRAGLLDGADIIVSRAYFSSMPTWPIPAGGAVPVGTVIIFRGVMGEVDASSSAAYLNISDYRSLLTQNMPRNLYQASCPHRLFDSRCTLAASSYTGTSSAQAGSTQTNILCSGLTAPGGSGTYTLGTIKFTSGLNSGITRAISLWSPPYLIPLQPFPFSISTGDAFSVTAGCDKQMSTCANFGNLANFGGEPYIPIPEVSLG